MPSNEVLARRRMLMVDSRRRNRDDAEACLIEVSNEFRGRTYDELRSALRDTVYRTVNRNGRNFSVIVDLSVEDDSSLLLTFQSDDGGLNMYEPQTLQTTIRVGEVFEGFGTA